MRAFRILLLLETTPIFAGVCVLVVLLASGPDMALLSLCPFVLVALTGRPLLSWTLSSGRFRDDSGVALRFIQGDFRRRAGWRVGWLAMFFLPFSLFVGFSSELDEHGITIAGAMLWFALGSLQLWVLADFLFAECDRDLPAQIPSMSSGADHPKRPEM